MDQEGREEEKSLYGGNEKQLSRIMNLPWGTIAIQGKLAFPRKSWWILMMVMTITGAKTQDPGVSEIKGDLPLQVLEGMDMSHASYKLEAFDCDEPEDVITRSIPQSCNPEVGDESESEQGVEVVQDYTILQKVPTFEYSTTLCTL